MTARLPLATLEYFWYARRFAGGGCPCAPFLPMAVSAGAEVSAEVAMLAGEYTFAGATTSTKVATSACAASATGAAPWAGILAPCGAVVLRYPGRRWFLGAPVQRQLDLPAAVCQGSPLPKTRPLVQLPLRGRSR